MRNIRKYFVLTLITLTACQDRVTLAPVISNLGRPKTYYYVKKGDNLFQIAWRYDKNFKELAKINHISQNATLQVGQKLRLVALSQQKKSYVRKSIKKPVKKSLKRIARRPKRQTYARISRWSWPVKGRVIKRFAPEKHQKGIDLAASEKTSVYASAPGEVAYSGDGLRGYGNLIIIKHPGDYLSAYAHNKKNYVKEGQKIKANQKIAEMGSKGLHRGLLHFEIRHKGKPIDPLKLLARR